MSKKSKTRNRRQGSLLGAVLMESIAVVVMIGLFFIVQQERSNVPTADEFIRPAVIEEAIPNLLRSRQTRQLQPMHSASNVRSEPGLTIRDRLVSTERGQFGWRNALGLRY